MVSPTFFKISLNFATRSSWYEPHSAPGCFYWLYRTSQSLAAKNIINLIFSIDHLVMSMCRIVSWVVAKGYLLWPDYSLDKTLLVFALLHLVLQGQTCLSLQVSLDFLYLYFNPLWWKGHLFLVLVLEGLIGLHRTNQFQLLWYRWLGHRLGLLWCWMVCLGNKLRSCCFWDCTQVLHFGLFRWYESYSISSKGFLSTVVDIMVVWITFIHSCPF